MSSYAKSIHESTGPVYDLVCWASLKVLYRRDDKMLRNLIYFITFLPIDEFGLDETAHLIAFCADKKDLLVPLMVRPFCSPKWSFYGLDALYRLLDRSFRLTFEEPWMLEEASRVQALLPKEWMRNTAYAVIAVANVALHGTPTESIELPGYLWPLFTQIYEKEPTPSNILAVTRPLLTSVRERILIKHDPLSLLERLE